MRSVARVPALTRLNGIVELVEPDVAVIRVPAAWELLYGAIGAGVATPSAALLVAAAVAAGREDGAANAAAPGALGVVALLVAARSAWRAITCRAISRRSRVVLDRKIGQVVTVEGAVPVADLRRITQVSRRFLGGLRRIVATRDGADPVQLVPPMAGNRHGRDLFTLSRWIGDFLDLPAD